MLNVLVETIQSGLRRKTIDSCSKWAEAYRIMGKPFDGHYSFKHHPWCRDMHDDTSELVVGMKAAQMGYTEVALNKAFYAIDVRGDSVLYILPAATPDASDFSSSRFDPALELSPHIDALFSDVKNVGHKRAGSANLFVRGSRSRSQLKSVPVSLAIGDELDEMDQKNVSLIPERMSGQIDKQFFVISTPTIADMGIHAYFSRSSQSHWIFRCPHCNRLTSLIFPECLIITSDNPESKDILDTHLVCKECNHTLNHDAKPEWLGPGMWVPEYSDRLSTGYHVSQLYSMTVQPYQLAQLYLKAQLNPSDEQEFYNSKLGLPHEVDGARVTEEDLVACTGTYIGQDVSPAGSLVTMGVDVGKWLHYEICQWLPDQPNPDPALAFKCRVLKAGKVKDFEELDRLIRTYKIKHTVVDINPETRKALELAQRFYGLVTLCEYSRGIGNKEIKVEQYKARVDRTSWLDVSLRRFRNKTITIPKDVSFEYRSHMKALVRIYKKDPDGNPVGKYEKSENAEDHHAHARNYAEIALQLAVASGTTHDIGKVL